MKFRLTLEVERPKSPYSLMLDPDDIADFIRNQLYGSQLHGVNSDGKKAVLDIVHCDVEYVWEPAQPYLEHG